MKSSALVILGIYLASCGPNMEASTVMTPEQRLQEQEQLAYEDEQKKKARGDDGDVAPAELDEREEFDKKQADMEMKRATLSARTCVDVVDGPKTKGIADINVVFNNDGHVRDATIAAPHADTPLGECVLNAYRGVIVPPFRESEFTMPWQLDFDAKPAPAAEPAGEGDDEKGKDKDKAGKDEKKSAKKKADK